MKSEQATTMIACLFQFKSAFLSYGKDRLLEDILIKNKPRKWVKGG